MLQEAEIPAITFKASNCNNSEMYHHILLQTAILLPIQLSQ